MTCSSILNMTINWLELMPFLYIGLGTEYNASHTRLLGYLPDHMKNASSNCGCPMMNFEYQKMNISASEEIEIKIRSSSQTADAELYFPVLAANPKEVTQYQRMFLPLFLSPGPAVVEVKDGPWMESTMTQVYSVLESWPTMAFCLLLGIVAGFVVWAIEHKKNPEDFPAKFPHGVLVGIWWSFVTMTTVGYGDKTTRTLWGRMFAVFWMVLGTIVMSVFTGQITANITSSSMAPVKLVETKVAIATGLKTFFEQEHNLGADYAEMSYNQMAKYVNQRNSSVKYYMMHDYKMAEQWVRTSNEAKIIKIIDRQFVVGMVVTGNHKPVERMLRCIQRQVIDLCHVQMARQKLRSLKEPSSSSSLSSSSPTSSSSEESSVTSQQLVLIVIGTFLVLLVAVGFLYEWLRKRRATGLTDIESQKPDSVSAAFPSFFDLRSDKPSPSLRYQTE